MSGRRMAATLEGTISLDCVFRLLSSLPLQKYLIIQYIMKYLSIRVDCDAEEAVHIKNRLAATLAPLGDIVRGTYGHEVSIKAKKPHFHWHIEIDDTKPFLKAFSQWVKREYDKRAKYEQADPLHHYSIKVLTETPDLRWYRYPFKDLDLIQPTEQTGFTEQELHDMLTQATTEREISKKTFEKHENKLNNDKQSRKLLWDWLDEKFPALELRLQKINPDRSNDPCRLVATAIVDYNKEYNDYKIPMDLKRRTICYLAYRGLSSALISDILWK